MLKEFARPFYHAFYRGAIRVRCYWEDRKPSPNNLPPAMLRFRVSESVSAELFLRIGRACADIVGGLLAEKGEPRAGARVLDFGCGCGRTIRWMIERHPEASHYGCDTDMEAIAWCQAHLRKGSFRVNKPLPPLDYEDSFFDAIYCFSVFTHLNEAMQDAWLAELRRVLKPEGVLILTVHGRNAARGLDEEDRAALEAHGFLHKTSRKLSGFMPEWYHTTWHSQGYILDRLKGRFGAAKYVEVADGLQDCVVAGGRVISSGS